MLINALKSLEDVSFIHYLKYTFPLEFQAYRLSVLNIFAQNLKIWDEDFGVDYGLDCSPFVSFFP